MTDAVVVAAEDGGDFVVGAGSGAGVEPEQTAHCRAASAADLSLPDSAVGAADGAASQAGRPSWSNLRAGSSDRRNNHLRLVKLIDGDLDYDYADLMGDLMEDGDGSDYCDSLLQLKLFPLAMMMEMMWSLQRQLDHQ